MSAELKRQLAFYGFPSCPLTDAEIALLEADGFTLAEAFGTASDVYCGFSFEVARDANRGGLVH